MTTIKMGQRVTDSVTGFSGIATGKSVYMNGCINWLVEAKAGADGKCVSHWFDEQRLGKSKATAGGPMPEPPRFQ